MSESSDRPDGLRIKAARESMGWTQQELAVKAGYKASTIQKVETLRYFGLPCLEACVVALGEAYDQVVVVRPPELRCRARFRELRALGDDGRVKELTRRYYYGKTENATLTIRGTEAHLIIENVTMYDDHSCSKKYERFSGRMEGHGSVVRESANLLYTLKDQTRKLSWAGVCVLMNVPTAEKIHDGKIHGYWMTAGHIEPGRTVLGTLELESTLT